jgi:hypothetical protein
MLKREQHSSGKPIREWRNTDRTTFDNEIAPLNEPAVLRGLADDWAIVKRAKESEKSAVDYLISLDNHNPAYTIIGNPNIDGRFFYSEDLNGSNFQRIQAAITATLEQLYALRDSPVTHSVAVQAASVRDTMPQFETENSMPLLDDTVQPTMWLGNKAMVAAHYDVDDNIACVATGKRRFTLFPPSQIANLYIGPTLNSPGGVPISMVDLRDPDHQRFPLFSNALAESQSATLEPGDAIYIPTPWWHAVESLDNINLLINYWWGGLDDVQLSPNHSLIHSMLTIAKLKPSERDSWRHFFDYLVFQNKGDPKAHLPDSLNDVVTTLTEKQQRSVYQFLKSKLD